MSFGKLIFAMAVLVLICLYSVGKWMDFVNESNRITINHALHEGDE